VRVKKANFLGGHGGGRTIPPSRRTEIGVGVSLVGRMNERLVQAVSFGSVFSLACPQARRFPSVVNPFTFIAEFLRGKNDG
jgi:hypothetical protein